LRRHTAVVSTLMALEFELTLDVVVAGTCALDDE
jgi:hypothetical protein